MTHSTIDAPKPSTQPRHVRRPPHGAWDALQAIFAVFFGLILAFVVGVGVNTFYPDPTADVQAEVQSLYEDQNVILSTDKTGAGLTPAQQLQVNQIDREIRALEQGSQAESQSWAMTTSMIIIAIATLLLAGAVLLAAVEQAWVFSTGMLLGGLFLMLYGAGWSLAAGESTGRFWVLVLALAITTALGYMRFVRGKGTPATAPSSALVPAATDAEMASVEQRLSSLERTMSSLRDAFGTPH